MNPEHYDCPYLIRKWGLQSGYPHLTPKWESLAGCEETGKVCLLENGDRCETWEQIQRERR